MLKVEIASFRYENHNPYIFKNIKAVFELHRIYSLRGDNGSGKTTLSLIIAGAIPKLIRGELEGEVYWNNSDITGCIDPSIITYSFQNPSSNFCTFTPRQELGLEVSQSLIESPKIQSIIRALSIESLLDLSLYNLSVGEQHKVALASALAKSSQIKILDEPFEFLDNESSEALSNLIEDLSKQENTFIIIDRHPWKREYKSQAYELSNSKLTPLSSSWKPASAKIDVYNGIPGDILLQLESVNYRYKSKSNFSLSDISFRVREGECLCLFGHNGSGKSTLLYIIAGLLKSNSGTLLFRNQKVSAKQLRGFTKLSFQDPEAQIFLNSVVDELLFGLKNSNIPPIKYDNLIDLAKATLPFDLNCDPFSLSYGQKKLLTIVASLILSPKIILLDEPTAGLDEKSIKLLSSMLVSHLEKGRAIILSSHDLEFVKMFCHRIVLLKNGKQIDDITSYQLEELNPY